MASLQPRHAPPSSNSSPSSLTSHNVVVAGRRTSVRLEPSMWEGLCDIARQRNMRLNDLITEIDRNRGLRGLTAAIRVYVLDFYRRAVIASARAETAGASSPG